MKILILSSLFPYPLKSGGHVRIYHLLKGLSKKNDISLLSLITDEDVPFIHEIEKYCQRVETVKAEYNVTLWSKLRSLFKPSNFFRTGRRLMKLLRGAPLTEARSYFPKFDKKLKELLQNESYHIIQVEFYHMAQYIQSNRHRLGNAHIVLDELEIAHCILKGFSNVSRGFKKFFYYLENLKIMRYEKKVWSLFDEIYAMSMLDKDKMLEIDSRLSISIIPNGVDTTYFQPDGRDKKSKDILFLGYLTHAPNIDGLLFFYHQIFPLVKDYVPQARIIIVGGGLAPEIEQIPQRPDVIFNGYVEDARPIMDSCRLMVVPLRIGSGTRLKILEALAQGLPVVTTTVGCEGIEANDGTEVSIVDTPEEFAKKIVKLLMDDTLCRRMSEEGRRLAEEKYSWELIGRCLENTYNERVKVL